MLSLIWLGFSYMVVFGTEKRFDQTHNECQRYLMSRNDNWTHENDWWYRQNCDLEYEYSYRNIRLDSQQSAYRKMDDAINFSGIVFSLIFLSYLGRWLVSGKTLN